jgi:membrane fusion protein (multidrug efflux system)
MMPSLLHRLSVAGCALSGALVLSACNPAGSQPGGMPPPEVTVVAAKAQSLPVDYEYVGQAQGSREVEVRARVTGIMQKRNFREGAPVARGQSLFTIDPAPFRIALQRAEATVAAAEARLDQARRNSARLKPLVEATAVSRKEYDDALAAERVADADLKLARAQLAEAKLNLEYTRVEAPIAGITSRAARSEGALISGPDILLTTITQTDPIWVTFGIPDREHLAIRNAVDSGQLQLPRNGGFEVTVKLADGSEFERKGRLDFSDVRVNPSTGTTETRAELPNPRGRLKPGQFVRVHLSGAVRPNAILVPQKSVLEGPQGKFVYIVNEQSRIEIRPVEVGDWRGEDWVIQSGLKGGERVVVDGLLKLGPGAEVRVVAPQPPGAPAGAPAPKTPAGEQKK